MRSRRFELAAVILAACIAWMSVQGCVKEKKDERFSSPKKTYALWLETSFKADIPGSMECMTRASQRFMDVETRERSVFLERMVKSVEVFRKYTVSEEKIKGDKGVVIIREPESDHAIVVPFQYEEGGWKVDLIAMFAGLIKGGGG